jgi:glycosyltransferase involved in cell wall biosynthesis
MRIGIDASRTFVENPTGTERYAYEVTTRLLKLPEAAKHEWILYGSPSSIPPLNIRGGKGVIWKRIPLKYLWTQAGLAARTWLDRLDVLWVPAHTLPLLRQPGWLRKGKPLRTVVTIHGIEYEWLPAFENPLQRWYLPLSTIYAAKTASKVISVSKFTKDELVRRMGVKREKIEVVWEGITPSNLPLTLRGRNVDEVLNKWGLSQGKYLLFVGTVQPRKNLERLIEAFIKVITPPIPPLTSRGGSLYGDIKLVISGKLGWGYERVVELVNKSAGKVILTGYIDDKERSILLNNAEIYIQPSITEGFGLPVLEAMAAGIPVVSSWGGALKEILEIPNSGKSAGLLFDPYDLTDMEEKIKTVLGSREIRKEMIEGGKKRAGEFSWDKAARETYNILVK